MDNTDASDVFLKIEDLGNSTDVVTSSNGGKMSRLVLDPLNNLSLFKVILDCVSLIDFGVGESNSSGIRGDDVGDFVGSNSFFDNFQQFEFSFSIFNFDKSESSLDIIEDSVVLIGFGKRDSIHNAYWELNRSSHFIINLNSSFFILNNDVSFTCVETKLEMVSTSKDNYLRMIARGRHSLSLCGPWLGLVA